MSRSLNHVPNYRVKNWLSLGVTYGYQSFLVNIRILFRLLGYIIPKCSSLSLTLFMWARVPPQPLPVGRTSVSVPMHVVGPLGPEGLLART
jgi:hypothetical protein